MTNLKTIIKDIYVLFDGDFDDKPQFPMAAGVAIVNGDEYEFEIVDSECMTGFPVSVGNEKYVAWVRNGDGQVCETPRPAWADEDDLSDDDWMDEVEAEIESCAEVEKIKLELRTLALINCVEN